MLNCSNLEYYICKYWPQYSTLPPPWALALEGPKRLFELQTQVKGWSSIKNPSRKICKVWNEEQAGNKSSFIHKNQLYVGVYIAQDVKKLVSSTLHMYQEMSTYTKWCQEGCFIERKAQDKKWAQKTHYRYLDNFPTHSLEISMGCNKIWKYKITWKWAQYSFYLRSFRQLFRAFAIILLEKYSLYTMHNT